MFSAVLFSASAYCVSPTGRLCQRNANVYNLSLLAGWSWVCVCVCDLCLQALLFTMKRVPVAVLLTFIATHVWFAQCAVHILAAKVRVCKCFCPIPVHHRDKCLECLDLLENILFGKSWYLFFSFTCVQGIFYFAFWLRPLFSVSNV